MGIVEPFLVPRPGRGVVIKMIGDAERRKTDWRIVARHNFGGAEELDATIANALDGEGEPLDGPPLYASADAELAEQFLASVDGDDASVVFSAAGRTFRVSADGTVEARRKRD